MTEDYKTKILDYITNNVTPETENNVPVFADNKTINKSVSTDISEELQRKPYSYSGYLCDQKSQNIIIYGYTEDSGFIYIMDKNLNKLAMITEFSSGSKLFKILDLHQDENGYIYGISNDDNVIRVLLLNNIFAKVLNTSYQVTLRNSYIIPNTNMYKINKRTVYWGQKNKIIAKSRNNAIYYMILINKNNNNTNVIRFTINVGGENEWLVKTLNINSYAFDFLIEKNNDNEIMYFYSNDMNSNPNYFYKYSLEDNNIILKQTKVLNYDLEMIVAKSVNEIYVGGPDFEVINSIVEKITLNNIEKIETTSSDEFFNIFLLEDIIYVRNYTSTQCKVGILNSNVIYYSDSFPNPAAIVTFFILKSYNLSIIYIATGAIDSLTTTKFTLDYNPLNYNGAEYSNYNQTLPKKGRLYSDNELIFARNLYNITLLNSTATSTLEVPNTLLNDVDIAKETLISDTNMEINNQLLSISKNIYETLYLNFINTLNVIDEDTNTQYPSVANYINQNIYSASKENCESSFIGMVAINYSSSTIYQNVIWNYVTDHYETSFVINATDEVPTLTFMSNDLSTVYLTKELSIESGNYYLVGQKLRIE